MKPCPYTFYQNNKEEGFRQKIPVIHWKTLTFFTFQIDPLWDGSQGVKAMDKEMFSFTSWSHGVHLWCVILLNHGVHNCVCMCRVHLLLNHGVHGVHGVHLLLNHGVHAVSPTWHHPPSNHPPLSTPPSLTQVSNLKLANWKLGFGQLANHFPPCPTSRSPTRDHFRFHTPQNPAPQKALLTSQTRRTANPGDPV